MQALTEALPVLVTCATVVAGIIYLPRYVRRVQARRLDARRDRIRAAIAYRESLYGAIAPEEWAEYQVSTMDDRSARAWTGAWRNGASYSERASR